MAKKKKSSTPQKPAKKPGQKAAHATVTLRVAEILQIRLDGAAFHDCVAFANEKGWNVSERQVGRYIEAADELLAERQDRKRRRVIARHIAQRQALYARAVNAADFRTALAVLSDEARLRGLYPAERREHTGPKGTPIQHEHVATVTAADVAAARVLLGAEGGDLHRDGGPQPVDSGPRQAP